MSERLRWRLIERAFPSTLAEIASEDPREVPRSLRASGNGISTKSQQKLDRLTRDRPDLRQRIIDGELTIDGAFIQAGFAVRKISVPIEPVAAAETLLRHFHGDQLDELIKRLTPA